MLLCQYFIASLTLDIKNTSTFSCFYMYVKLTIDILGIRNVNLNAHVNFQISNNRYPGKYMTTFVSDKWF